jgi:HEAT repeat protein
MFRLSVLLAGSILFASPCRSEEPRKLADCLRRLDHEDADERAEAARLVGQLTSEMLEDMKAETLQTGRLTARDQPFSLGRCAEQMRVALEALRIALRDRRTLVRAQAAAALAEVASRFNAVAAATAARLDRGREWTEEMRRQLREVVLDLIDGLRDASLEVQEQVVRAIEAIGPEAVEATPFLLAALGDPRAALAAELIRTLARLGKGAAPEVARALADQNPHLRRRAAEVLALMESDAATALPILTEAARHGDAEVRLQAIGVLAQLGDDALPALRQAARDPDPRVQEKAQEAVRKMSRRK